MNVLHYNHKGKSMKRWLTIFLLAFLPVGILGYFYVDRVRFGLLLSAYGLLSIGRIVFQVVASNRVIAKTPPEMALPAATLIVPVFNEDPRILRRALRSFKNQKYPNLEIIVIDDGSDNPPVNEKLVKSMGMRYLFQDNAGKREAMYQGFQMARDESRVILLADSDTVWHPRAAEWLVRSLFAERDTGAVTGYVGVLNPNVNLLTRLIHIRYYMAFQQERAAQSLFGAVTCVSGPLGAYRRSVIERVKDDFLGQRFLGKTCTFGDDRHLTNLVLARGLRVRYASQAYCVTDAPTTLMGYITQQTRWGKSHWREMIWQFMALPKQSLYLAYDWMLTLMLPFLLVLSMGHYAYIAVTGRPWWLLHLLAVMFLMSAIRVLDPIRQTKDFRFLLFIFYTAFHLAILLPLKFYALLTVNATGWGTRAKAEPLPTKA